MSRARRRRGRGPTGGVVTQFIPAAAATPCTWKTYTAAEQILALVAEGRTVGITGPSHAVIHHLIDTACEHASQWRLASRISKRADPGNPFLHDSATGMTNERLGLALCYGELDVAAGTVWLWALTTRRADWNSSTTGTG